MKSNSYKIALAVTFLTLVHKTSAAAGLACSDLFPKTGAAKVYFERGKKEKEYDWKNEASYLEAYLNSSVRGTVRNFFSEKWDTRVYYTANGTFSGTKPQESRVVDPEARAVFVFIHGSGTVKSGGKNFTSIMNVLEKMGFSAVSFDLPFHSEGPTKDQYMNLNYTVRWLKGILDDIKTSGKPVYLVGHSFGPDVIFELSSRYPLLLNGGLAASPAGFNKILDDWYVQHTEKMKFGGDVMTSELGSLWSGAMSKQFLWNTGQLADPTVVNPNFRLRILSGDREEYVPAPLGGPRKTPIGKNTYDISVPLKARFKNSTVTIEEGVGHYIFDHVDVQGHNVFVRELMALVGSHPRQLKELNQQTAKDRNSKSAAERLGDLYQTDYLFSSWLRLSYGRTSADVRNFVNRIVRQDDSRLAKKVMDEYIIARKIRDQEMIKTIENTKNTDPEFYQKHQKNMDGSDALFPAYLHYKYGIALTL